MTLPLIRIPAEWEDHECCWTAWAVHREWDTAAARKIKRDLSNADGINSTIRALTLTTAAPSDLGAMNWRSIAPIRPAGLTSLQMYLGDGCMFGLVPMGAGCRMRRSTSNAGV